MAALTPHLGSSVLLLWQICSSSLHGRVRSGLLGVLLCVVFLSSPIHWLLCLELLVRSDPRWYDLFVLLRWCFVAGTICPCSSRWGVVLARSKPLSIGWCNLDGWWTVDRFWIPLKRAVPVFALSGPGGFVVTSAVGDPDRGSSLLCAAACGLGSCVQLREAV
ncbi:hypothetical protein ACOSQ3_004089 [Xanthoceras sorbifolium]